MEMFLVGGYVRDILFNRKSPSKDKDYLVVGCVSYDQMVGRLLIGGYSIGQLYEEKFTARMRTPQGEWVDFVWARKDGEYINGEMVNCHPGTFEDDIFRRDYTINGLAQDMNGNIIDIVGGKRDIDLLLLRTIGEPKLRYKEDPRRITRGIRFIVQFDLVPVRSVVDAWRDTSIVYQLANTKYMEKVKEELNKAFAKDSVRTLRVLENFPLIRQVVFDHLSLSVQLTNKKLES